MNDKSKTKVLFSVLFLASLLFSCADAPRSYIEETEPPADLPAGPADLIALVPADNEIEGWVTDGEPRFFDAGNLWEFINGAAEGYLAYGFEEVITADYLQEGSDQGAVIDVYRMRDSLNAFGIYSQERNTDYEFMDIGGEGYIGGTALNFWQGPYYVKITVFDQSDDLEGEMIKMATRIAGKIDEPAEEPAEVTYFPTENKLPHSVQYLPRDVLGQSYLVNAFESRYQSGDQEYKIILSTMDDSDGATEGMAKYRQFLSQSGRETTDLEGVGDGGFTGEDSFYGKVLAVRAANRILIVLGIDSEDAGKDLLSQTLAEIESGS